MPAHPIPHHHALSTAAKLSNLQLCKAKYFLFSVTFQNASHFLECPFNPYGLLTPSNLPVALPVINDFVCPLSDYYVWGPLSFALSKTKLEHSP